MVQNRQIVKCSTNVHRPSARAQTDCVGRCCEADMGKAGQAYAIPALRATGLRSAPNHKIAQ